MKIYALVLGILAVMFLGRVVGQVLVVTYSPPFLPPMQEWYSGLLPYRFLLPVQLVILLFQFEVSRQLWTGSGTMTRRRPTIGTGLKWFALVYFLVMATRYVVFMIIFPERRWFGGTIPIFFHFVLALYVYLLSRYYRGLSIGVRAADTECHE